MEKQHLNLFLNEDEGRGPRLVLVDNEQHGQSAKQPLHLHRDDEDFFDPDSQFGQCVREGLIIIDVEPRRKSGNEMVAHVEKVDSPKADIPTTREEIAELKKAYECRGAGYLVTPTIGFGPLGDMLTRLWLESRGQSTDPPSAA